MRAIEPAVLADFHASQALNYPLLTDQDARHVSAYGVLNQDYGPGDMGYGIPYPGILYIASDGTILLKFAVPGYRQRPPFDALLAEIAALQSSD